jgi:hypothetical protein
MRALVRHLRGNAIAYTALFVALGGTGYAAMNLPKGSVGAKQIKNHSIVPVKFNHKSINGSVRAWAIVNSSGKLVSGGGSPRSKPTVTPASYAISWGVKLSSRCASTVTVDSGRSQTTETVPIPGNPAAAFTAGYAVANSFSNGKGRSRNGTVVTTFNQSGQPTPLAFDVVVVC